MKREVEEAYRCTKEVILKEAESSYEWYPQDKKFLGNGYYTHLHYSVEINYHRTDLFKGNTFLDSIYHSSGKGLNLFIPDFGKDSWFLTQETLTSLTVINLTKRTRYDRFLPHGESGGNFIWDIALQSPDHSHLAVSGGVWGCSDYWIEIYPLPENLLDPWPETKLVFDCEGKLKSWKDRKTLLLDTEEGPKYLKVL